MIVPTIARIRRAKLSDMKGLATLAFMEFLDENCISTALDFSLKPFMAAMSSIIENRRLGAVFVADSDFQVVGMIVGQYGIMVTDWRVRILHEIGWYVLPQYRGHGIGTALLTMFVQEATDNNAGVSIGMSTANNMWHMDQKYKELGFQPFQIFYHYSGPMEVEK